MRELFLQLIQGISFGTLTGLTPGLHVNSLSRLALPVPVLFIMGLVHTFLDSIPSALFGVPDGDDTVPSLLPSHRMVLQGRFGELVRLSVTASTLAVILAILAYPLYARVAPLYRFEIGVIFIVFLSLFLILSQRNKIGATVIFLLSGFLGYIAFGMPLRDPFYPLFTGLFALPLLVEAYLNPPKEVKVSDGELTVGFKRLLKFSALGTFFGALASLLPTLTAGQASLLGSKFTRDDRDYLTIIYSTNTAAYAFSLANLALTGKTRNGVMVAIGEVSVNELPFLYSLGLSAAMLVIVFAPRLAILMGKVAFKWYRQSILSIMVFLFVLGFVYNGLPGIFLMLSATFLGFLAPRWNVFRVTYMGVLMLPVLVESII
ncbi:tripartite tricarboxylate transporter permease [Pyrococcus sp. ST04]|uniref:tripartite tricarboxylate transporter permease n=1 Tax=Pyrococcus sp. ST04 TaxID=1183377 RepID=UPI00064EC296|nr:tripartite tricarboxylate transporter permease [Pyrococcus sp. ST04]